MAQYQYPLRLIHLSILELQRHFQNSQIAKAWKITSNQLTHWRYEITTQIKKHWSLYHKWFRPMSFQLCIRVLLFVIDFHNFTCMLDSLMHLKSFNLAIYRLHPRRDHCERQSLLKSYCLETWYVLFFMCPFLLRRQKWKCIVLFLEVFPCLHYMYKTTWIKAYSINDHSYTTL